MKRAREKDKEKQRETLKNEQQYPFFRGKALFSTKPKKKQKQKENKIKQKIRRV